MLTQVDNDRLTRTGPGTDMGAVFRAYWQPALLSRELTAAGPPVRVRILGEDFLAFRDGNGQVGVVEPRCPHRGADLYFGRNESCGLRCAYHGWQFDVHGQCIDVPTAGDEQADRIRSKAAIQSLTVREQGDMVWVHFGQPGEDVPQLDFMQLPSEHYFVSKKLQQCNWAQAVEGGLDTAHFSYLHANIEEGERVGLLTSQGVNEPPETGRYRWMIEDAAPRFTVLAHDAGLLLCAARQADDNRLYWRMTQFLLPNHSMAPNSFPGDNHSGNTWVPIDDQSCWIFCYAYNPERPLTDQERELYAGGFGIFAEVDEHYIPLRRRENEYLLDRDLQKQGNFTGIVGVSEQDAAIADSQGLIADRTRELLGQTDLGVVRFRQAMFAAADAVQAGRAPPGSRSPAAYRVRSGDAMSACDAPADAVAVERFAQLAGHNLRQLTRA